MSARLRAWFRASPVASLPEATDGELVTRFVEVRDDDAFAELVRRHGPMVLATCRRVLHPDVNTADDAFQAAFLVLATKAASVSPPERVGAWLHGVAALVARKARTWARRVAPSAPADLDRVAAPALSTDPDAGDLRAKIDDVLAGLPSKYRAAVVLCDLEQRSRKEAATLLGWSEGALSGRLARARKLLADRLTRRGVSVPAAGLGVLLPASAALANVPVQLAASTIRTAALAAAGAGAEAVPASVAALAQGVSTMHSATKALFATGLTAVGLALGGFGLYALTAAPPAPAPIPVVPLVAKGAPTPAKGWGVRHTLTHKDAVTAVAFPTADVVAVADKGGVLKLYDADRGKETEELLDGKAEAVATVDRLQSSPDGKSLLLTTNDGDAYHLCSVQKEGRLFPGGGSGGQSKSFGVTADGKHWIRADGKRVVRLLENRFDENIIPFLNVARFPHDADVEFVAASDADVVATVADGVLRQWSRGKDKPLWEARLGDFTATALAADGLSKVFAVGGKSGEVRVYAGLTGRVATTLKGHDGAVTAVAFSADGKRVATAGADKTARVWDAVSGKELAVLKGHADKVTAVAFGPDGEALVTGSADKTAKVWEFKK